MTTTDLSDVTRAESPRSRRASGPAATGDGRRRRGVMSSTRWAAVGFAAPLLAFLVLFYGQPLWRNLEMSLRDYNIRAFIQGGAEWVGFANYVEILTSPTFRTAGLNTAFFVIVSLVFQYAIGLGLAVFFRQNFRLSGVLRALFLVPWLLPLIVSASTWSWMMNSDNGIINQFLGAFGIGQINWLTSPDTALLAVTIANIWLGIPFNLVILYSGLQNIPNEAYEASAIDGAGPIRQFWSITFPLLRPVSAITLLLGLIYTLKVVDVIWIMTSGGPVNSSTTFAIWSYQLAFGQGVPQFSIGAALGNIMIVIALFFGLLYVALQRRQEATA